MAGGLIVAAGPRDAVLATVADATTVVDVGGRVITPGLVDAHTHLVWAGSRVNEFAMRVAGADYLAIAAAGGGIASTVRSTRAAADGELLAGAKERLDALMVHGATTVEAKTGYGLSLRHELRLLDILGALDESHPVHLVATFLGAHSVPDEYSGRADDYVTLVVDQMLPVVAERNPGAFCDVFCDEGAFSLAQAERILVAARALGLRLKAHSDEFAALGCTELAAALGATSIDHLVATTPAGLDALAPSGTVAVLLPGTTFGLASRRYAAAREFVGRGVPVALGTDLNPGTCPCPSLPFIVALATRSLGLTPAEALVACTRNAAYASGCGDSAGQIAPGRPADLTLFDTDDYRDIAYQFGVNPVAGVLVGGSWTVPRGEASPRGPRL